jgi:replicative DNA helicase
LAERQEQTPTEIFAVDGNYAVGTHRMTKVFYSGRKIVYELTTRTGRTIKASANHPFLKLDGWTRLDGLQVGDKIAVLKTAEDLLWDEIVSITELGVEDVYDATVEGVHNFVANDIVVHNSLEQDADVVVFVHRPEMYGIMTDENNNPTEGSAEIIIGKQRNGPTDDLKLAFVKEYARFENLAYRQPTEMEIPPEVDTTPF